MRPITIYYDGDCPFCARYVRYTRLAKSVGAPHLVDVRRDAASREALERDGYDIDKGMVVDVDGQRYFAADAMHALALLSTPSSAFNRVTAFLFSHRRVGRMLYPLLRACRNAVVLALGRGPVRPAAAEDLLTLFAFCWGLFACFHFLVYAFDFYADTYLTTYLIPVLGAWLALHPRSRATFLMLVGVMTVDAWLQMPVFSNHTIMKNFFLVAILASGVGLALRGDTWTAWFRAFAPVGRAVLLVMYVFGVFHKLNTDFLDPAVSCANVLWAQMPPPLRGLDAPWFGYVTAYGTLVIETAILAFLLIPRLRHAGIVSGILFHMLLALSGYALYSAFSALAVSLHVLFLSPAGARQIVSAVWPTRAARLVRTPRGMLLLAAYAAILVLASVINAYPVVALGWFAISVPLLVLVLRHGRDGDDRRGASIFVTRRWWLNAVSAAFFLNCITPYLGLKTAQSINMFANLRLEGGFSNHLVLPGPPGPFGYLEDLVEIRESTGSDYLDYVRREGLRVTYYDLLNRIERNPHVRATFERGGKLHAQQSAETLRRDIEEILHPRWVRNWFHFVPVDLETPKRCARDR